MVRPRTLAVPEQPGMKRAGGFGRPPGPTSAAPHALQLLQGVQNHIRGVFGGALTLQLTQLTQRRAHGGFNVL